MVACQRPVRTPQQPSQTSWYMSQNIHVRILLNCWLLEPLEWTAIQSVELVDLNEQTDSLKWIRPPRLLLLGLHFAHWVQGDADKSPSEAQSGRLISRPSFRPDTRTRTPRAPPQPARQVGSRTSSWVRYIHSQWIRIKGGSKHQIKLQSHCKICVVWLVQY